MAYGIKYTFTFDSINGSHYVLNLLQDGYSGSSIVRPLGKAPVIKMSHSGAFLSTSLDVDLECRVDGEFAELYTTEPQKFRMDVFRTSGIQRLVWSGYVATELYAEPEIAVPYDVSVTATDGLGLLKEYTYTAQGPKRLRDHFLYLLGKTGMTLPCYFVMSISESGNGVAATLNNVFIDLDYLAGKSFHDVLSTLLETLHLTVMYYMNTWVLIRETDISAFLSGVNLSAYYLGTRGAAVSNTQETINNVVKSIGTVFASSDGTFPVGYLTRRAIPAKRSVTVSAPWNAALSTAFLYSDGSAPATPGRYRISPQTGTDYIYFRFYLANGFNEDLKVTYRHAASGSGTTSALRGGSGATAVFDNGTQYYYHTDTGWTTDGPETFDWLEVKLARGESNIQDVEVAIPAPTNIDTGPCWVEVRIYGQGSISTYGSVGTTITNPLVSSVLNKGYKDVITIDNGARGEADDVELTGSPANTANLPPIVFLSGAWYKENAAEPLVSWYDRNSASSRDYLALAALDRALSVALPRIELSGVLDFRPSFWTAPLFLLYRGTTYQILTYEWDLWNDDFRFTATSLPAGSLEVESEVVTSTGSSGTVTPSSSSSSSGGGGGGGEGGGSVTSVGLSVPTGLSVSGSPITTSGTLRVSLAAGYTIPLAEDVNKGVTAHGWGDHSVQGYIKSVTAGMIQDALHFTPADEDDLLDLYAGPAPKIQLYRGYWRGTQTAFTPFLKAEHPAMEAVEDAEFVLMTASRRKGRRTDVQLHSCRFRKGWGVAGGKGGGAGLTFSGEIALDSLRTYILNNYISIYGGHPDVMPYSTFHQQERTAGFGFPDQDLSEQEFKAHLRSGKVFGIACRYPNPEFLANVTGTVADHTVSVKVGGKVIPRWIYSDVAPFRVVCHNVPGQGAGNVLLAVLGIEILP